MPKVGISGESFFGERGLCVVLYSEDGPKCKATIYLADSIDSNGEDFTGIGEPIAEGNATRRLDARDQAMRSINETVSVNMDTP